MWAQSHDGEQERAGRPLLVVPLDGLHFLREEKGLEHGCQVMEVVRGSPEDEYRRLQS